MPLIIKDKNWQYLKLTTYKLGGKMVRKKLVWYPGAIYHITTRGNHRNDIFRDGEDYLVYLTILKEALERHKATLYCYCLMTNHVHLIVETSDVIIRSKLGRLAPSQGYQVPPELCRI